MANTVQSIQDNKLLDSLHHPTTKLNNNAINENNCIQVLNYNAFQSFKEATSLSKNSNDTPLNKSNNNNSNSTSDEASSNKSNSSQQKGSLSKPFLNFGLFCDNILRRQEESYPNGADNSNDNSNNDNNSIQVT